jgi:hypothetical protein
LTDAKGGKTKLIRYADGTNVTCTIGSDTSIVGSIELNNQQICIASSIYTTTVSLDGLIGVGVPGHPSRGQADVFYTLILQNPSLSRVLTYWFNVNTTVPMNGAGVIGIGGIDSSKYMGSINYIPLSDSRYYWALSPTKVTNAAGATLSSWPSITVIFDTGTTLCLLPTAMARAINAEIGATYNTRTKLWMIDCKSLSSTPAVAFYFSGSSSPLVLSGNQFGVIDNYYQICYSVVQDGGSSNLAIFGSWFLRSF